MKSYVAIVILVLPTFASGASHCSPPESFSEFFARYQTDSSLQSVRVARKVLFAKPADAGGEVERIERTKVTGSALLQKYGPFPDGTYRSQQKLVVRQPAITRTSATVEVVAEDSDSYHRIYKFRRIAGCWVLRGFEDNAL